LRNDHVLFDFRLTQRNRIEHCDSEPTREFVVKPEIEIV
jgi:hypothetical protein